MSTKTALEHFMFWNHTGTVRAKVQREYMKTEFKARPAYLNDDQRIKAHFTTCFIALVVFKYLEKALDYKYTYNEIITGLREMNFLLLDDGVYVPTYTRTKFTDDLHKAFGFSTDKSIFTKKPMIKIISSTKNR